MPPLDAVDCFGFFFFASLTSVPFPIFPLCCLFVDSRIRICMQPPYAAASSPRALAERPIPNKHIESIGNLVWRQSVQIHSRFTLPGRRHNKFNSYFMQYKRKKRFKICCRRLVFASLTTSPRIIIIIIIIRMEPVFWLLCSFVCLSSTCVANGIYSVAFLSYALTSVFEMYRAHAHKSIRDINVLNKFSRSTRQRQLDEGEPARQREGKNV